MFRRRDEDEVEYTLQPANRNAANPANSGFAATNQAPGQLITTHAPNNMPYNPAAHSLAQANAAQSTGENQSAPSSYMKAGASFQAALDNVTAKPEAPSQPQAQVQTPAPKEIKVPITSTPKANPSMNTFVPSAIRASSNPTNSQNQPQPQSAMQQNMAAPKQQPLKVDNIGLETERRLTVGYGIALEGKVSDCDKLVIYGNVNAELNNVKALQISDSGCFRGAAEIDYAEISGIFEGELRVRKSIVISSTGRVSGKITYSSIEIKPGGKFTGEIIEAKLDSDNSSSSANNERSGESRSEDFSLFSSEQKAENRAA